MKQQIINIARNKVVLFLVISLWISAEYIILGPFSYMKVHDTGDSFITRYMALSSDFYKHGVSYWFPEMGAGVDRLAQDLSYMHGTEFLFLILPGWLAYQLIVFIKYFIAGYFTYRVANEHLQLSSEASLIAGIGFSLFHLNYPFTQFGFSFFPFFIWGLAKIHENSLKNIKATFWVFPLGLFYGVCTSLPWSLPFTLMLIPLWLMFIKKQRNIRFLLIFSGFAITAIAWHSQSLWALHTNAELSHRMNWPLVGTSYEVKSMSHVIQVIRGTIGIYFHPLNQYNHVLFFPLIMIAIFLTKLKNKQFNIVLMFFLFTTVGVVVIQLVRAVFYESMGPLKGFQVTRIYNLTHFFYPICAAYAVMNIPRNWVLKVTTKGKSVSVKQFFFVCVLLIFGFQSLLIKNNNLLSWIGAGRSFNYAYGSEQLKTLANTQKNEIFRVASIASSNTSFQPAFANAYGLETVDGYMNIYPHRYQQFWLKIVEPLTGVEPYFRDYIKYWGNKLYLFIPQEHKRYDAIQFSDYYRLNLLSLANTKYLISTEEMPIGDQNLMLVSQPLVKKESQLPFLDKVTRRLKEIFVDGQNLYIYENKDVLPRFFLTSKVKKCKNTEDLLSELSLQTTEQIRNTVYLEEKYLTGMDLEEFVGVNESKIDVLEYAPDKIRLSVESDGNGFLIVSNSFSPHWKVTVNGIEKKILPAYHTFWGVLLREKNNEVLFYYDPPYKLL